MANNKAQHVISHAILRQFTNTSNKIGVFSKLKNERYYSNPKKESRVADFLGVLKDQVEPQFQSSEQYIPTLRRVLDNKQTLGNNYTLIAKNLIALHLVRSLSTHLLWQQVVDESLNPQDDDFQALKPEIMNYLRDELKISPTEHNFNGYIKTLYHTYANKRRAEDGGYDLMIKNTHQKILDYLGDAKIEIGVNNAVLNFILPDTGIFIKDSKTERVGILNGVGLTDADIVILPFTPRYLISLVRGERSNRPEYTNLFDGSVTRINSELIQSAHEKYYFYHPAKNGIPTSEYQKR